MGQPPVEFEGVHAARDLVLEARDDAMGSRRMGYYTSYIYAYDGILLAPVYRGRQEWMMVD